MAKLRKLQKIMDHAIISMERKKKHIQINKHNNM